MSQPHAHTMRHCFDLVSKLRAIEKAQENANKKEMLVNLMLALQK